MLNYLDNLLNENKIEGYGFVEEFCLINSWKIRGFFSIGAYTNISKNANIRDVIIGRFSKIDTNVNIGKFLGEKNIFSNSDFSNGIPQVISSDYEKISKNRFFYNKTPLTKIGNDVWIQENCIIKSGVTISDGVIVLPNSLVIDDLPPFSICSGNPAQVIGYRFEFEIIERLQKYRWWDKDIFKLESVNYSNIKKILNTNLDNKKYQRFFVDSFDSRVIEDNLDRVLIGPSHIKRWRDKIYEGDIFYPNFYLIGFSGLSLYDKSLIRWIDFFTEIGKEIFLMVPDFRIGNSYILNKSLNPTFIDKDLINLENDTVLYNEAIKILDHFVKLNDRIKFIFWCLGARENLNIKNNKYIVNGSYKHPIWNLEKLNNLYFNNTLQLDSGFNFEDMIENDGTVHPTNLGYNFIKNIINGRTAFSNIKKNKYKPNILIRTYRWDEVNNLLALYYKEKGANVIFVVDETKNIVNIPSEWSKVSINKDKIKNKFLRYQDDIMWRSGDYCYYFAFDEFPEMERAWLVEDEAIIYSDDFLNFLEKFEMHNIDFYAGKFGKRGNKNYLYKTIDFINRYPYGCIYSISMMTNSYAKFLYKKRVELNNYFIQNNLENDKWMNDEYFSINMSYGTQYCIAALQDVSRWCCSQTLHFSTQKVLMKTSKSLNFEYQNRFYHPILVEGLDDSNSLKRNKSLLNKYL